MDAPLTEIRYRPLAAADIPGVYRIFRRSLFDYLHRTGQVDAAMAADPPIDEAWTRQRDWIEHLVATAAEDWVAEDADGRLVGWALSVERDGVLELTHFFVDPPIQARGIGRALLERAFPLGRGRHRTIIATQDTRALGLYLKFGVGFAGLTADFFRAPREHAVETDLSIERADPGARTEAAIAAIERELLGHERRPDIRFLLDRRPAWLARRGRRVVGFAIGEDKLDSGPIAALDPADIPALLATVENDAAARGSTELYLSVPLANRTAVDHALRRGFKMDTFYVLVLADRPMPGLDRWVHTEPVFIL